MHIPDGFIAPQVYLPSYAVAAGLWTYGAQRAKRSLDENTLPTLAVLSALSFAFMSLMLPLPGGTSVHATGVALLAVFFGIWTAFLAVSLVLLIQALLLGSGGLTALPVNALALGMAGSAAAVLAYRALRPFNETAALFTAGWISVNLAALLMAVALGLQPLVARAEDGTPLFFPFGLKIVLPAVLVPHALLGIGEGALTVLVHRFVKRLQAGNAR